MRTVAQRAGLPLLASTIVVLASPNALPAQLVSARPASISLTVVVPSHVSWDVAVTSEGMVALVQRTGAAVDLETAVGLGNRPAARIEVRLASERNADSTRVWVRNRRGEFEQLMAHAGIVAFDSPSELDRSLPSLRFRVETKGPLPVSSLAIPLEYRLTVGAGDEFSVWTFPSLLRVADACGQCVVAASR